MEPNYNLTILFSNYSIEKIFEIFTDYLHIENGDICAYKIVRKLYKNEYKDTSKTLILMKKSLYQRVLNFGLDKPNKLDFRIELYIFSPNNYPGVNYISDIHIKIPSNLLSSECETLLEDKMKNFISAGFLKTNDYYFRTPLESRIIGNHKGFINLFFHDNVDLKSKIIIKLLLDDCIIYKSYNQIFYISAFWMRIKSIKTYKK